MGKQLSMPYIAENNIPAIKQSSNLPALIPRTLRTHCISVRLNNAELQLLNTKRDSNSKGEWLRMASLLKLPTIVPPINLSAWKTLGDINQKLNRIALHIDSKSATASLPILSFCRKKTAHRASPAPAKC